MAGLIGETLRSWKRRLRSARARAEIRARRIEPRPHGLGAPLIVSLTSYPARFATLPLVLRALRLQTVAADRVILWLAEADMDAVTPAIRETGVELRACPDWRSYKKIVPTLSLAPDAFIVTADDDAYYGPRWLEGLVARAQSGVVCHRANRIALGPDGLPLPYARWQRNIARPERSALVFPTGVGGVLYAPGIFHPEVSDPALFMALAPSADDVWLYWMHRLTGSRPEKVGGRYRVIEWPGTQERNLRGHNLAGDGNDSAVRGMIARYGFPPV